MPDRTRTLRRILFQAGFISLLTLQLSCRHEMDNLDTYKTVCFQTEVLPVFINSCSTSGCHSQSSGEGGRVFSDYTSIMKSITPKDPYNSEAYLAITGKKFSEMMPPHGVLTQDERMVIKMWIMQGAEETTCTTDNSGNPGNAVSANFVCFDRDLLPVFRSSCAMIGCHDQATHKEGVIMTDYASIMSKSGLVVPSSPTSSDLYKKISLSANSEDIMPPKPNLPLTKAVIDSVYNWIKRGALNQTCETTCVETGSINYTTHISATMAQNCVPCHRTGNAQKGVNLDNYTSVKSYALNGKLVGTMTANGYQQMPPSGRLADCPINQVKNWITQGTPQN